MPTFKVPSKFIQDTNRTILRAGGFDFGSTLAEVEAHKFVTCDPDMIRMKDLALQLSKQSCNVVIYGETGTGKEIIARVLHGKRDYPNEDGIKRPCFAAINCAGLVDTLFESEIFGYEPGVFTGGKKDGDIGLIRKNPGGTIFMDEIGDLPLHQQTKLLRVLEERKIRPIGGHMEIPFDARFVFATNKPLRKMIESGAFREDLYYRIAEIELETKPLRDRPEDVPIITERLCRDNKWVMPETIHPDIVNSRGNVRALRTYLLRNHISGAADSEAMREAIRASSNRAVESVAINGEELSSQTLFKITRALGADLAHPDWPKNLMERIRDLIANQAES